MIKSLVECGKHLLERSATWWGSATSIFTLRLDSICLSVTGIKLWQHTYENTHTTTILLLNNTIKIVRNKYHLLLKNIYISKIWLFEAGKRHVGMTNLPLIYRVSICALPIWQFFLCESCHSAVCLWMYSRSRWFFKVYCISYLMYVLTIVFL